jgi:hypothetical protein
MIIHVCRANQEATMKELQKEVEEQRALGKTTKKKGKKDRARAANAAGTDK